jgi:hypothetical protein
MVISLPSQDIQIPAPAQQEEEVLTIGIAPTSSTSLEKAHRPPSAHLERAQHDAEKSLFETWVPMFWQALAQARQKKAQLQNEDFMSLPVCPVLWSMLSIYLLGRGRIREAARYGVCMCVCVCVC